MTNPMMAASAKRELDPEKKGYQFHVMIIDGECSRGGRGIWWDYLNNVPCSRGTRNAIVASPSKAVELYLRPTPIRGDSQARFYNAVMNGDGTPDGPTPSTMCPTVLHIHRRLSRLQDFSTQHHWMSEAAMSLHGRDR